MRVPRGERWLNASTLMGAPTAAALDAAVAAGFVGIEARAERLCGAPDELAEAAEAVREGRGRVWSLNGLRLPLGADGGLELERLRHELDERLAICAALRAPWLLVVPPRLEGLAFEAAREGLRAGLRAAAVAAAPRRVRLAFEFLHFADSPVRTPARARELVAALPEVGLVLDSSHLAGAGVGPAEVRVAHLAIVHLNDADADPGDAIPDEERLLPGAGRLPLTELVGGLNRRGYRGPWSVELFPPGDDPEATGLPADPGEAARAAWEALDRTLAAAD